MTNPARPLAITAGTPTIGVHSRDVDRGRVHEHDGQDRPLPVSPSGRVPQWVLEEAAGRPVPPVPWRQWPSDGPAPRRAGRRRSGIRAVLSVALVVGLSLGAAHLVGPRTPAPPDPAPTAGPLRGYPTPSLDASTTPLGSPLPAPPAGGTHAFVALQADGSTPVSYDPCRPIHYVTRPDNAPEGGGRIIRDAVDRVSAVTGLQFVDDGATAEASTDARPLFQPDSYGDRWAPVLISWQTAAENAEFAGSTVGEAGSAAVTIGGGPKVFVTGTVDLDAEAFELFLAEPDGEAFARAVVLHELGHLVGLDHVDDAGQLMFPDARHDVLDFQDGDLTGLARLGAGACVPQL